MISYSISSFPLQRHQHAHRYQKCFYYITIDTKTVCKITIIQNNKAQLEKNILAKFECVCLMLNE
jgi:hypothetical protein